MFAVYVILASFVQAGCMGSFQQRCDTAPSSFLRTSRLQAMMLLSCSCANGFLSNMSADRSLQSEGCRGFKQLFSPQVISCLNLFDTCD